ncbi:MAG TPA: universal stress protein [Abditibacteriaceae bacterium]|nr:universal stress protein [Abditibacteriaceae bacterium]
MKSEVHRAPGDHAQPMVVAGANGYANQPENFEANFKEKMMTMLTFKKILCPTDFSEASYEALARAVALAEQGMSELCVVHVEPPAQTMTALAGLTPSAEDEPTRRAAAIKNLCAVLEERVPAAVRSRALLKQGEAAEQIVRAAQEEDVDLIVLTTHGARGWQPGVLGSVAEAIVRTAACPVLSISGPAGTLREAKDRATAPNVQPGNNDAATGPGNALRPAIEVVPSHRLYLDGD